MDPRKKAAEQILLTLEQAGFEAYLVGGCVRDQLLNRTPQDYDIATNAHPTDVQQLFARTVPTGLKHGTVTVIIQRIPIEVTTFRVESDYQDHRRPNHVEFVSTLKEDLARRDFTINAMALDRRGKLYDYYGGLQDLKQKRIRTVGNPKDRFTEDPLRMIRAARFLSQLQFSPTEEVKESICQLKEKCIHLSVERIIAELEKIWLSQAASEGLSLLYECDLFAYLPPFAKWNRRTITKNQLKKLDPIQDRILSWAYFLYLCIGKKEEISGYLSQLRLSGQDKKQIAASYQLACYQPIPTTETEAKKWLLKYGIETCLRATQLQGLIEGKETQQWIDHFSKWWKEMPVKQLSDLAINGRDLIQIKQRPGGAWVKQKLNGLLEQVALGILPNCKEQLLKEGCKIETTNHS